MQTKSIQLKTARLRNNAITNQIYSLLGDGLFDLKSWDDLIFHSLKLISPINRWIKNTPESLEKGCDMVNTKLGLNLEATIYKITEKGQEKINRPKLDPVRKYRQMVLQLDQLPYVTFSLLNSHVKEDLLDINALIDRYEQKPVISAFLKKGEVSRKHEERMLVDFYERCTEERVVILKYYLEGIKKRALDKAWHKFPLMPPDFLSFLLDYPYYYARPYGREYFDIDQIDLVSHRLGTFPIQPDRKLEMLYKNNKAGFYRLYFKRIPVEQHFQSFMWHLAYLPLKNDRTLIFKELRLLFNARRWVGFYALALPQIEGLFSEMCTVIRPDSNLSQHSLTSKVEIVRPFYSLSRSYFDYYQYVIPIMRNKFAHTGYDDDFKLKSFDLLSDLHYLLTVFYELDNAMVKVKKLHTNRDFRNFINIVDFAAYFELLDQLMPSQRNDIKVEISDFEQVFLLKECSIEYIIDDFNQNLLEKIDEFLTELEGNLAYYKYDANLYTLKPNEITGALKDENLKNRIAIFWGSKSNEISQLHAARNFLKGYSKHLKSLAGAQKTILKKLSDAFMNSLAQITELDKLLKVLGQE